MRRNNIHSVVTFLGHNLSVQRANLANTFTVFDDRKLTWSTIGEMQSRKKTSTCIKGHFYFSKLDRSLYNQYPQEKCINQQWLHE